MTGGGGGIGRAMCEEFLKEGKKVIICGRTEANLQTASKEMSNCPYYVLDTGDIKAIPAFLEKVTKEHPDLDCLVNNAGVQRPLDVNEMEAKDFLEKADNEIAINVNGPIHLAVGLLEHFKQKPAAVIINISSILGYLPTSIINPIYNGTKSLVHFWSMNLRTQLEQAGANIRVIEIAPPTVSTDLHRERKDPNDNKKEENPNALSLKDFIEEVVQNWKNDLDVFGAGPSQKMVDRWNFEFLDDYNQAAGAK